mmetsp:Transcript_37622/g.106270  ORF Transcript_37622/g.106270 Transcript_37622/m.106270 type:complete len:343 (+) Transcript_37622:388-1416(+)
MWQNERARGGGLRSRGWAVAERSRPGGGIAGEIRLSRERALGTGERVVHALHELAHLILDLAGEVVVQAVHLLPHLHFELVHAGLHVLLNAASHAAPLPGPALTLGAGLQRLLGHHGMQPARTKVVLKEVLLAKHVLDDHLHLHQEPGPLPESLDLGLLLHLLIAVSHESDEQVEQEDHLQEHEDHPQHLPDRGEGKLGKPAVLEVSEHHPVDPQEDRPEVGWVRFLVVVARIDLLSVIFLLLNRSNVLLFLVFELAWVNSQVAVSHLEFTVVPLIRAGPPGTVLPGARQEDVEAGGGCHDDHHEQEEQVAHVVADLHHHADQPTRGGEGTHEVENLEPGEK